jgi:hypothetical protein
MALIASSMLSSSNWGVQVENSDVHAVLFFIEIRLQRWIVLYQPPDTQSSIAYPAYPTYWSVRAAHLVQEPLIEQSAAFPAF